MMSVQSHVGEEPEQLQIPFVELFELQNLPAREPTVYSPPSELSPGVWLPT